VKFGLGAALRYLGAMLLVAVLACAPATAPMAPNHAGATKTDEHESESALVARLFVPGPRMPRDVTEVTVAYPWLSVGRVYWVEHPPLSGVLVVVAALGDGPLPVRLTGDTAALSQFLSRQFNGRFPGAGRFRDVAELLRDVTLPRAAIGSAESTWSDKFTSAIGYSLVDIDNTEAQTPRAFKRGQYALVNLLYYPVKGVMMGGELQWGRRANHSVGFIYNDYRIQFSFKYDFAFTLERRVTP
jgi:hypothetical protein